MISFIIVVNSQKRGWAGRKVTFQDNKGVSCIVFQSCFCFCFSKIKMRMKTVFLVSVSKSKYASGNIS